MSDYPKFRERPLHHKLSGVSLILLLILGGFTVWSAFMKPTQKVTVQKGGQATFIEKPARFFIPYIEVGVEQNRWQDVGTYVRAGLRIEF